MLTFTYVHLHSHTQEHIEHLAKNNNATLLSFLQLLPPSVTGTHAHTVHALCTLSPVSSSFCNLLSIFTTSLTLTSHSGPVVAELISKPGNLCVFLALCSSFSSLLLSFSLLFPSFWLSYLSSPISLYVYIFVYQVIPFLTHF